MALIPQSFIADLLNRIDIVDVVGQHVKLKKAGANYQGLCPFHQEKSPSFSVSPTKQFYHCFGCGAHGSAISFMMEYAGLGYVDTIEELARSAGLTVPREERTANDVARLQQTMALSEVMSSAADWYRQQLKQAPRAVEYLKGRGLTGEIAKRYSLGYAPDGWQGLEAVFGTYANDEIAKTLLEGGLLIQSEQTDNQQTARRYDRFRDRIMFPIRNPKGQVIGFGGRILDQGEPKYLNSPETPLFSKGNTLYGLFEARQAIRAQEYVLVCEGYMDVVALAQLGFPNAVATLGTACTANHVRMLLRQTDRIVFSFDGDAAGQRAAQRALEACLPLMSDDKEIRFLFLPTEHDPDSYVRAYGAPAFEKVIKEAMSLSSFFFKIVSQEHELTTPEGRAHTHHAAKPLLLSMPPIALRTQILREVAIRTNSTPAELESFCGLTVAPAPVQSNAYVSHPQRSNTNPHFGNTNRTPGAPWQSAKGAAKRVQPIAPPQAPTDLAEQLLRVLIQFPHLGKSLDANKRTLALKASKLRSEKAFALMQDLLAQCDLVELIPGEAGKPPSVGAGSFALFQEQLSRSEFAPLYEVLRKRVMGSDLDLEGAMADLEGSFKKLELTDLKQEMTDITQKISGGTATDQDRARYRELGERLKFN
ncbi:DNA primase [Polynucleobacter sphagniphilus]|jgi:DNA primase|uniref:DNA primase n=1 Tax=Polynucleobacter sphagniphilus TaxID=1743169 RepID=A0AA43S461_9BURK|nr:DNA primase [Polynucleobacter sphagniphilus]MDH6303126.1 DNA primase [Polynucleobacter sphagniphilus]MDH6503065.1 DNA primase [Polynucleobacter sphagniphilus]MDH6511726.1 DNA primase [Polynucleobacter sphagniphilus]